MKLAILLLFTSIASAQTWFKIAPESPTTTVELPTGTNYRLGSGTCWSATTTVGAAATFAPLSWPSGIFPFADPCPGVVKELDVLETSWAQTVTVNGKPVSVPLLPTVPAAPLATLTYSITLNTDGTYNSGTCQVVPK